MEHDHMLKLCADARAALHFTRTQDSGIWSSLRELEIKRLRRLLAWLRRELRAPAASAPSRAHCRRALKLHRKRLALAQTEVRARTRPIWKHEQDVMFETHYVDLWKARLASAPKEERAARPTQGTESKRRVGPSPAALAVARLRAARAERLARGSHAAR